MQSQNWLN